MPYIAPPDLRSIYGDLSTIPADFAYDQAVQSRQANALNMEVERQKLAEDSAASPFNLAAKASKMRNQALEDDLSTTLYPGRKEIAVAEQQKKQRELQAPDIHYLAQGLTQAAAATKANGGQVPVWLAPQLPKSIVDALNQPRGADQVFAAGKAIRDNADKFVSQESKQGSAAELAATKADSAENVARINAAARVKAAELANERARATLAAKPKKADAPGYEKYAQKLDAQADELAMLGDAESMSKAQYLKQLARQYYADALKLKTAPTDVKVGSQEELERELNVRKPAGQAAPAAPATPTDRVRVQSADGKIGTIPKSQLKDALAQGYKEYK